MPDSANAPVTETYRASAPSPVENSSFEFPSEYPPFPAAKQTPIPSRKPATVARIPNPDTDPRGYYDYCTSAAAYWKTRADKAVLPVEVKLQNAAMQQVVSYRAAALAIRDRAFASPDSRPRTAHKSLTASDSQRRSLEDELPPPLTVKEFQNPEMITNYLNKLTELRIITVLHIQLDEAQVNYETWTKLKLDLKRTIGVVLAYHLRQNGRSGHGRIIDELDGKLLATFDMTSTTIVGLNLPDALPPGY